MAAEEEGGQAVAVVEQLLGYLGQAGVGIGVQGIVPLPGAAAEQAVGLVVLFPQCRQRVGLAVGESEE